MTRLRLKAPAKINWTLEVLRVRPDSYHEISSVLQTIALHDVITVEDSDDITLELTGDAGSLADEGIDRNLAYRAAVTLRDRTGVRSGARITLEKHVPIAAGLGGGSSDAAAVLRALHTLWDAGQPAANLIEIAGEIGSDPPFFVVGGTAEVAGRGDAVTPLQDAIHTTIVLATPPSGERGNKTAAMYAALGPEHYTEGDATIGLREIISAGRALVDAELANVFERVIARQQPETALAMASLQAQGHVPHLCGSGPSFFLIADERAAETIAGRISELGFEAHISHTLRRDEALRIEHI